VESGGRQARREGLGAGGVRKADQYNRFAHPQVEQIELSGILGLGKFEDKKIQVQAIDLRG
jgi:hypothetical protein